MLAHQIEAMARQKKLQPVEHYLQPLKRPRNRGRKPSQNAEVAALLDRLAAKQNQGDPDGQ